MDAPALYKNNFACVGQDELVRIGINSGQQIESTVNVLKIVIFWYDRRHGTGELIDDIDLHLYTVGSNTPLMKSESAYDNKERLFYTAPGGKNLEFGIYGYDVTADSEGCGTNKQRVYWTYFYEDSARDDVPDGPTSANIQVE